MCLTLFRRGRRVSLPPVGKRRLHDGYGQRGGRARSGCWQGWRAHLSVLYGVRHDLEHGVLGKGPNGRVDLVIYLFALALSVFVLLGARVHRHALGDR